MQERDRGSRRNKEREVGGGGSERETAERYRHIEKEEGRRTEEGTK